MFEAFSGLLLLSRCLSALYSIEFGKLCLFLIRYSAVEPDASLSGPFSSPCPPFLPFAPSLSVRGVVSRLPFPISGAPGRE